MSALVLTLKQRPPARLDCSNLTPDGLVGLDETAIRALPLRMGKESLVLGDLFEVTPGDQREIRFEGPCDRLDRIGQGMKEGRILLQGDGGRHLGAGLKGGSIAVEGSVSDYLGAGMSGGEIRVTGNAGDFLGGALPGGAMGQRGGLILVAGSAGTRACDRMRRGIVVIGSNLGDYGASRMIAGSLVVMGKAGEGLGYAMKRGTLLLGEAPAAALPATFADCGSHDITFLALLLRKLAAAGIPLGPFDPASPRVRRYAGDAAVGGLGEILIRET